MLSKKEKFQNLQAERQRIQLELEASADSRSGECSSSDDDVFVSSSVYKPVLSQQLCDIGALRSVASGLTQELYEAWCTVHSMIQNGCEIRAPSSVVSNYDITLNAYLPLGSNIAAKDFNHFKNNQQLPEIIVGAIVKTLNYESIVFVIDGDLDLVEDELVRESLRVCKVTLESCFGTNPLQSVEFLRAHKNIMLFAQSDADNPASLDVDAIPASVEKFVTTALDNPKSGVYHHSSTAAPYLFPTSSPSSDSSLSRDLVLSRFLTSTYGTSIPYTIGNDQDKQDFLRPFSSAQGTCYQTFRTSAYSAPNSLAVSDEVRSSFHRLDDGLRCLQGGVALDDQGRYWLKTSLSSIPSSAQMLANPCIYKVNWSLAIKGQAKVKRHNNNFNALSEDELVLKMYDLILLCPLSCFAVAIPCDWRHMIADSWGDVASKLPYNRVDYAIHLLPSQLVYIQSHTSQFYLTTLLNSSKEGSSFLDNVMSTAENAIAVSKSSTVLHPLSVLKTFPLFAILCTGGVRMAYVHPKSDKHGRVKNAVLSVVQNLDGRRADDRLSEDPLAKEWALRPNGRAVHKGIAGKRKIVEVGEKDLVVSSVVKSAVGIDIRDFID